MAILFPTSAPLAFKNELAITNISSTVRIDKDIRVMGVKLNNSNNNSYIPPIGNNIQFVFTGSYTPPVGDNIIFNLALT